MVAMVENTETYRLLGRYHQTPGFQQPERIKKNVVPGSWGLDTTTAKMKKKSA